MKVHRKIVKEAKEKMMWHCPRCGEFEAPPLEREWGRGLQTICPTCGALIGIE